MARPYKHIDISGGDRDYNVSSLQSQINKNHAVEREVKQEFTRLRDIAQKRIKRMNQSEFSESEMLTGKQSGWTPLKSIKKENLATAFHELQKFVSDTRSTVRGQRKTQEKTLETLRKEEKIIDEKTGKVKETIVHGIDVNKKNYWAFWSVMHEMRSRKIIYGSDKAQELADVMLQRKVLTNSRSDRSILKKMEDAELSVLLQHTSELDMIPAGEEMGKYALQLFGE